MQAKSSCIASASERVACANRLTHVPNSKNADTRPVGRWSAGAIMHTNPPFFTLRAWLADFSLGTYRYMGDVKACPESQNSTLTSTFPTKQAPPTPLLSPRQPFYYGLLIDSLR